MERLRQRFLARRSSTERLLMSCAQLEPDVEDLRALDWDSVAWHEALHVAVLHQVTPLVYRNLQAAGVVDDVPEEVVAQFRQAVLLNMESKGELRRALVDALDRLRGGGHDVLLAKGTALDVRLYPEPWLTTSQDLDLVVLSEWAALDEATKAWVREVNHGTPLIDVHCEKHADLVMNGLLPLDFPRMINRASEIEVDGRRAWLLAPEDELICACIQAFRKRYFRLKSLCEIAGLLRQHPEMSWDEVCHDARAEGCAGIVYVAVSAAALATGCALPSDLAQRLGISAMRRVVLHGLLVRMSRSSLATLYVDRWVRGKQLGWSLLLPYASLGLRKLWRSLRIVSGQAMQGA